MQNIATEKLIPTISHDDLIINQNLACSRAFRNSTESNQYEVNLTTPIQVWTSGEAYNLHDLYNIYFQDYLSSNDKISLRNLINLAYSTSKLDLILQSIDGYFTAVICDNIKNKVLLISDRHGLGMTYWYHKDNLFAWSSSIKPLLGLKDIDKSFNTRSFNTFFELGYLIGENTLFKHIRLIKPSSVIEYDIVSNSVSQRYYWDWSSLPSKYLTFDEAIDCFHDLFMQSVLRRFDDSQRIGISLSGGLDSRAILAAVSSINPGYKGYLYTFGLPNCMDIKIASQVASQSGLVIKYSYHPLIGLILVLNLLTQLMGCMILSICMVVNF